MDGLETWNRYDADTTVPSGSTLKKMVIPDFLPSVSGSDAHLPCKNLTLMVSK